MAQRSLDVAPDDLRAFQPCELDLEIAEAMLAGCILQQDIADHCRVHPSTVSKRLRDPVLCAWLSETVHRQIQHRLGLVDAAIFNRACGGDVRAADLLYKRFDQMTHRSVHVHLNTSIDFDPTTLSDDELDAHLRAYGSAKDVEFREVPPNGGSTKSDSEPED